MVMLPPVADRKLQTVYFCASLFSISHSKCVCNARAICSLFSYFVGCNLCAVHEILEMENGICLQTKRSGWRREEDGGLF